MSFMTQKESSAAIRHNNDQFVKNGDGTRGGFSKGTMNGPDATTPRGKRRQHEGKSADTKTMRRLEVRQRDYDMTMDHLKRTRGAAFNPASIRRPGSMKPTR